MTSTLKEAFEKVDNTNVNLEVKISETLKMEKPPTGKGYMLIRTEDATGSALMKVYKEDQFEKFDQQPSLLLMNVIKKTNNFIFTNKSMASYCKPVTAIQNRFSHNNHQQSLAPSMTFFRERPILWSGVELSM